MANIYTSTGANYTYTTNSTSATTISSDSPEYQQYIDDGYKRHLENQAMHMAQIKGRYAHLNLDWTPTIEKEAMKRDGGGITNYLEQIAKDQERIRELNRQEEYKAKFPMYGQW